MAKTTDNHWIGKLIGLLVDLDYGNFVVTITQEYGVAGNLDWLLVQGGVFHSLATKGNPRVVARSLLDGGDIIDAYASLI